MLGFFIYSYGKSSGDSTESTEGTIDKVKFYIYLLAL